MSSEPDAPQISIVIPAYNEALRLPATLQDLKSFFGTFGSGIEILLVIEKSSDGTVEMAREAAKTFSQLKVIANDVQRGKGFAVKTGMLRARGDVAFFMDLDLSTPLVEVLHFMAHFGAHPEIDVLIGSRQHAQSQILKKQHFFRRKMGQTFNRFVQLIAMKGIKDTQCGFKAFRKKTVRPIFSRQTIHGFSFDVEILLIIEKLGYSLEVLPVKWLNSPHSKVRFVRDSVRMFFDLLKMKRRIRRSFQTSPIEKDPK